MTPSVAAPDVLVLPDAEALASAVAARLLDRLRQVQAERGDASVVLTGGSVGIAVLRAVRDSPDRAAVDWRTVDVWWGDERWVEVDSPDRNDGQAREALLDHLDLDPARVHPMAWPGGPDGDDPETAADAYAQQLAGAATPGALAPAFDVLLLGMGPEGHTASIFPKSPAAHDERAALAVHGCPKPPPTRISLGFAALTAAEQVWVVAAGAEKAPMLALARSGVGRVQVPVAGARGRERTVWLLDEAAAQELPPEAYAG